MTLRSALDGMGAASRAPMPASRPGASFRVDAPSPAGDLRVIGPGELAAHVPDLAEGQCVHLATMCDDVALPDVVRVLAERHGPVTVTVATWRYAADWSEALARLHASGALVSLSGIVDGSSRVRMADAPACVRLVTYPCHAKIFLFSCGGLRLVWMASANLAPTGSAVMLETHVLTRSEALYARFSTWIAEMVALAGGGA